MKRVQFIFISLALAFVAVPASAFFDPPWLTPEHPAAGQQVSVNIRGGICDGIDNVQSIVRNENKIHILFFGVHYYDPLHCNNEIGQAAFPIGTLPAGDYVLTVDFMYFTPGGGDQTDTLGVIPFTVSGIPTAAPAPAPAYGVPALILLGAAIIVLAWRSMRSGVAPLLLAAVLSMATPARAQTIDPSDPIAVNLLLSTSPGAPTPQQLVSYYTASARSSSPPLAALASHPPMAVQYLLPNRASGDFLTWLNSNPASPRAVLERYLVLLYSLGTDIAPILAALRADAYVTASEIPPTLLPMAATLLDYGIAPEATASTSAGQYGRTALNVDAAWQIAGGWALVAVIDFGLYEQHPALRQFSSSNSYFGNFIPAASYDVGRSYLLPPNSVADHPCLDGNGQVIPLCVDENRPLDIPDSDCKGAQTPITLGHGTHVAGLIAANGGSGRHVQGTCKNCGISLWKVSYNQCDKVNHNVILRWNYKAESRAITSAVDTGAQVLNMSLGGPASEDFCTNLLATSNPGVFCLALLYASERQVAMVASSGNDREDLNVPAAEPMVISAGGFQENMGLWDESPGSNANCPYFFPPEYLTNECGSNYTIDRPHAQQEVIASARAVLSTTYPGKNYNNIVSCGDGYPGPGWGNGTGLCSGTSMSAPQISGIIGILRSINPLARVGLPTDISIKTVRGVLAHTTREAQAGQQWTPTKGYGRPDAAAAARMMLGGTSTARNRVTPLFRLYAAANQDYADVSSPQYALALMINQANAWRPISTLPSVPGYPQFPHGPNDTPPGSPSASVYVMATEVRPRDDGPELRPLYLMDKSYVSGPDFMLATTKTEVETAVAAGYQLRNIQGYIYAPCTHEPGCIPAGAVKFWRKFNATRNDCATFIQSEYSAFDADGYKTACPAGPTTMLGYVYPNSAPCGSNGNSLPCYDDRIFRNGFDVL